MADKKISALTAATTPLAGTEVLPIVQSGATVKVSAADVTAGRAVSAASQTLSSGNLTFSSTAQRITGDMSNATIANRLAFQTSTVNGNTTINVLPNGTSAVAQIQAHNNSDPTNAAHVAITATSTVIRVQSGQTGSAAYLPLGIYTGGSNRWQFETTGNVTQQTASTGFNFTANTPAAGMTSQLLNWYEEGTWTPTYTTSTGAFASVTYGFQNGKYIRIGKMVYITMSIRTTAANITGATGLLQVAGLPFTAATQSLGAASMSVSYATIFANVRPMGAYVASGGTVMYLTYISNPVGSNWTELNATELSTANPANQLLLTGSYICA
jgi:hypothetical protein